MVIQLHSKDQNILPQSTKERWYGRIAAFLGTFVELKAIISSIFRKIGREVYCTCLENKRTCECSRGSNPLSSAILVLLMSILYLDFKYGGDDGDGCPGCGL